MEFTAEFGGMQMVCIPTGEERQVVRSSMGFLGTGAGSEEVVEKRVRVFWPEQGPAPDYATLRGPERDGEWWHSPYGLVRVEVE